jgi:hypothetical protein
MKSRWIGLIVFLSFIAIFFSWAPKYVPDLGGPSAWGDDDDKLPFPKNATVTTLITTPRVIFGLTGDNHHNYTPLVQGRRPARFGKSTSTNPALFQSD